MEKRLSDLIEVACDVPVRDVTQDSRLVQPGALFLAYPGETVDGRDFMSQAIAQGASAILYEPSATFQPPVSSDVPILPVENLSVRCSEIAGQFYDHPSARMQVVGVTGTNGKTSCTQFLAQALHHLGQPCGIVGTLGQGVYPDLRRTTHTTPDAVAVQKQLHQFLEQGARHVAMEVSSHSLVQHRVAVVDFDIAVFTNLSRDHLDYHGDMENYGRAKARLFEMPSIQKAVINVDDPFGRVLAERFEKKYPVLRYALAAEDADIRVQAVRTLPAGFDVTLSVLGQRKTLTVPLMGRFNLSNVLAVLGSLLQLGVALDVAVCVLAVLQGVPGRMQRFGGSGKPWVIVDYAHTPDALAQALQALRAHCAGRVWCVFGCGGDRDRGKRAQMGAIAAQYSDAVVVTNDNPRSESPDAIAQDILSGMPANVSTQVELDREKAIMHAIGLANPEDIVLVAGKGHEAEQRIGDKTFAFSDSQVVLQQLQLR